MGSPTLPWGALWKTMWGLIPSPITEKRIMVALDDSINPKSGRKIFGCAHFHDHAAKNNQSSYPWSQCILVVGLLKKVKSRWACLPLDFRFYMMQKDIEAKSDTATRKGEILPFESKMEQAASMLKGIHDYFQQPLLIVTDSWFGNNGLWSKLDHHSEGCFHLLSRMRSNINLFDFPQATNGKRSVGRPKKYGDKFGNVNECAALWKEKAQKYEVFLYGKQKEVLAFSKTVMLKTMKCPVKIVWVYRRTQCVAFMTTDLTLSVEQIIEYYGARWKIEAGFKEIKHDIGSSKSQVRNADAVLNHLNFCLLGTTLTWIYADHLQCSPDRKHKIRGRAGFAFSDVRKIIAEAALDPNFQSICPVPVQRPQNSFIKTLLRMIA